jgi:hypothetical protein
MPMKENRVKMLNATFIIAPCVVIIPLLTLEISTHLPLKQI